MTFPQHVQSLGSNCREYLARTAWYQNKDFVLELKVGIRNLFASPKSKSGVFNWTAFFFDLVTALSRNLQSIKPAKRNCTPTLVSKSRKKSDCTEQNLLWPGTLLTMMIFECYHASMHLRIFPSHRLTNSSR